MFLIPQNLLQSLRKQSAQIDRVSCTVALRRALIWAALLLVVTAGAACGRGERADANAGAASIREARPTFTPVIVQQTQATAAPATAVEETSSNLASTENLQAPTGATVIINSPLVNVRAGPELEAEVIEVVERGQEFDIIGRDEDGEWWQVCCIRNAPVWVVQQLADTIGPVDSIPVIRRTPAAIPTVATVEPATSTDNNPAALPAFNLVNQERFPESSMVRIYMYVYAGDAALADYSLRVTRNGTEIPVNTRSFGGSPGFTWPFQDARQRSQNWKAEFPSITPEGLWQLELIDAAGNSAGAPATFQIGAADTELELYVRYERR